MPLSSLSPSAFVAFSERFASPHKDDEHRPSDSEGPPTRAEQEFETTDTAAAPGSTGAFGAWVKTDLSTLGDVELWIEPKKSPEADAAQFLGCFAQLLASVRDGDAGGARAAAAALQLELFGGPGAANAANADATDAPLRMLDDFRELLRSARLGDVGGAERAACSLAGDLQIALLAPAGATAPRISARRARPRNFAPHETSSLVQGANDAYETLMDYDVSVA